jgi:cell filamentation protein
MDPLPIFQDVYPWAGQFRTTLLGKAQFAVGPITYFTPPHLLEHEAQRILDGIHRANLRKGLSRSEFALKAARLLVELNNLHPYREGNGRTQRIFIEALARQACQTLRFDVVSRERMIRASILSRLVTAR